MTEIPGLSDFERRSFNLAGHGTVGTLLDIEIRNISVSTDGDGALDFAALRELVSFRDSPRSRISEVSQKYIAFALSGIASELVLIEKHFNIGARSKTRISFLRQWQTALFEEYPLDVDFAYFVATAWLRADETKPVEEKLNLLWGRTYNLAISEWPAIEMVACRLRKEGSLAGDALRSLLETA